MRREARACLHSFRDIATVEFAAKKLKKNCAPFMNINYADEVKIDNHIATKIDYCDRRTR